MKTLTRRLLVVPLLMLMLVIALPARAYESDAADAPSYSQQELDRMLAPIALYPDSLLTHILMAATYPLEVVEAARWSRANPHLTGQDAVRAVEDRDWDPSVKSLVAFPRILHTMDEKLRWTEDLGNAFLAQREEVMDTVQQLRQKAHAAGHLHTHEHYRVVHHDRTIVIESPYPEVIYVPYYSPLVVYGPWWWASHPPVYWNPWPHYHAHYRYPSFYWSVGIVIGPRFFFGVSNWRHRHIVVATAHPFYYHAPRHRTIQHVHVWHHDPHHRRGVAYRHPAVTKQYARDVFRPGVREFRAPPPHGTERRVTKQHPRPDEFRWLDRRREARDARKFDAPPVSPVRREEKWRTDGVERRHWQKHREMTETGIVTGHDARRRRGGEASSPGSRHPVETRRAPATPAGPQAVPRMDAARGRMQARPDIHVAPRRDAPVSRAAPTNPDRRTWQGSVAARVSPGAGSGVPAMRGAPPSGRNFAVGAFRKE